MIKHCQVFGKPQSELYPVCWSKKPHLDMSTFLQLVRPNTRLIHPRSEFIKQIQLTCILGINTESTYSQISSVV